MKNKNAIKVLGLALIACAVTFTSCKKDNDSSPSPTPITQHPDTTSQYSLTNEFTVNGGSLNNYKIQFVTNTSTFTGYQYQADSTVMYMGNAGGNFIALLVHGSTTGAYTYTENTKLSMYFKANGVYYAIACDSPAQTGNISISSYGAAGGKIKGIVTASATAINAANGNSFPVTVNGKFEVTRVN